MSTFDLGNLTGSQNYLGAVDSNNPFDATEDAKASGSLGDGNSNDSKYLGIKTFDMKPGDKFGFMLVPNGTVQQVFNDPNIGGASK